MPEYYLKPKIALITGASGVIGNSIVDLLAKNTNLQLIITGRDEAKLKYLKDKFPNILAYLAGDLADYKFREILINSFTNQFGGLDILINNAGIYDWSPIQDLKLIQIDKTLDLNLKAPIHLCHLVSQNLKIKKWGRIINIGSISGSVGEANASLYSASKAGLIGLTKSLALELAEYGITSNLINPGWVKSRLSQEIFDDINNPLNEKEELDCIPQKRWIEPSEIAHLVNYLISESACGLTGQIINLCAGLSLG